MERDADKIAWMITAELAMTGIIDTLDDGQIQLTQKGVNEVCRIFIDKVSPVLDTKEFFLFVMGLDAVIRDMLEHKNTEAV